ncbi:LysR family transcriptional regulator [Cupriavidus basilensis]|uniref:LysR family transcriptional regulator n=1 Tax=Cupriavidus basilensis TaxID=68895 RepID=A0A643FTS8_9BURK|nr:LysR family transcriptional regulator [Cupriavidus basilensis]QOT77285.1 LysR family transcriptional regulator [Cupriavidus basilensis]
MDWSDIKIFLAIARAGTLGGAARAIGQTQPTMGRRLKALEDAVGHALFQRTSDGYVLTDEGAAVLAHAERIEAEAIAFERQLSGQARELDGMLRISSSDWFGVHMLTPVIADFIRAHPRVAVELVTDARLLSLARREADLVFRIRAFDEADIVQRKLMHMDYALYSAPGVAPPRAGDGEGHALLTLDAGFADLPDVAWMRKLLPNARVAFGSNSREAQAKLCAAGAGLAVLPCALAERLGGLQAIDMGEAPPGRDVWVGYHRDLRRLGRLRAFLDATIERLGNRADA